MATRRCSTGRTVSTPDTKSLGHHDHDHRASRDSSRMLRDLAREEGVVLVLHSHDVEQRRALADVCDQGCSSEIVV